jgi:prepilin peptidase CpaA
MTVRHLAVYVPDALCILLCAVASFTDIRKGIIPNWLTLAGVLLGLSVNTLLFSVGWGLGFGVKVGLLSSLAGLLLLAICFGLLASIRFVAWGDVKLMAAVGALLRWPDALWALAYVAIAGGVLGLVFALGKGRFVAVFRNLFKISKRLVGKQEAVELHRIPYALAILGGATWAALVKYFPVLRIG